MASLRDVIEQVIEDNEYDFRFGQKSIVSLPPKLPDTLTEISISNAIFQNDRLPEQITSLTNIEILNLHDYVSGIEPSNKGMQKLRKLTLHWCSNISRLDLTHLKCLEELTIIDLFSPNGGFPNIRGLTNLKKIYITIKQQIDLPDYLKHPEAWCTAPIEFQHGLESIVFFFRRKWPGPQHLDPKKKIIDLSIRRRGAQHP